MPTKWPCPEAIDCPCADGNPAQNYSAENPDPFTHFARRFFPNPVQIDDPPGVFTTPSCGAACTSAVSQADADACALREAVTCVQPPAPPGPGDPVLFGNRAISCQADCPEGDPFILNIAAGTYLARTQELADAIAQSYCQADVLQFKQCGMPGPGPNPQPGTPCPHITGTSPPSPVNLNEGDSTTLVVSYTYASNQMLMFIWFIDGVATYSTMNATLPLNNVGQDDAGDYVLGIYAQGCFPVFSNQITVNVTSACPPEVGNPAPDTLDIPMAVTWETLNPKMADWMVFDASYATWTLQSTLDHPPGEYVPEYVTGFLTASAGLSTDQCAPAPGQYFTYTFFMGLLDDEHADPNGTTLSDGFPNFHCGVSDANHQAFFNLAVPNGGRGPANASHTNTGGMFKGWFDNNPFFPFTFLTTANFFDNAAPYEFEIKIIQLNGQIPQPRKLKIDNFGLVAGQFTDPSIGANWNGHIDTRTTYDSATLNWTAPSSGGFGGATVEWISNHPTSANGYGWRINIYNSGAMLVWSGLAATELTPLTRFYKDFDLTPMGPACLTLSDNSDTAWSPPQP